MKKFSIIAAIDEKNGISKNGKIPWELPKDLTHFVKITSNTNNPIHQNAIMMGRKTWSTLNSNNQPLINRINVVLSSKADLDLPDGVLQFENIDQALQALSTSSKIEKIFIIGGGKIFEEAILHPSLERIYITKIEKDFNCDTFFPNQIPEEFEIVSASEILYENNIDFEFLILESTASSS